LSSVISEVYSNGVPGWDNWFYIFEDYTGKDDEFKINFESYANSKSRLNFGIDWFIFTAFVSDKAFSASYCL
jgi:hypothetical protein